MSEEWHQCTILNNAVTHYDLHLKIFLYCSGVRLVENGKVRQVQQADWVSNPVSDGGDADQDGRMDFGHIVIKPMGFVI